MGSLRYLFCLAAVCVCGCSADVIDDSVAILAEMGIDPTRDETTGHSGADSPKVEKVFQPLDPDRQNPFRRPQEFASSGEHDSSERSVRVKGFANVNGVKAILVIDGKPAVLRVGEQAAGLEVIEIAPPQVHYTRDGVRSTVVLRGKKSQ